MIIVAIILGVLVINSTLIQVFLDEKTWYKECDIYDQPPIFHLFLFFGIFTLPFLKQIRKLRRKLYYDSKLKELRLRVNIHPNGTPDIYNIKLDNLERQMKLERLIKNV